MVRTSRVFALPPLLAALCFGQPAGAQQADVTAWLGYVGTEYRIFANLPYHTANGFELRLTIYSPKVLAGATRTMTLPNPTLIYFNGGGWEIGSKEHSVLDILPYLEMGWTVVTPAYRLRQVSNAPAAVEDARCALRWVVREARTYQFDTSRIVLSGGSAGGHLALTTGLIPTGSELDSQCPGPPPPRVAAIINWFGITDVVDLLEGPNRQQYAVTWVGSQSDRMAVARKVSPLTYLRADAPPILTIHGTADDAVPYTQSTRLHQELTRLQVPNQLLTIPDGGHGGFTRAQSIMIYDTIRSFLATHHLGRTVFAGPSSP
jgi:acetyl esterase/lipase